MPNILLSILCAYFIGSLSFAVIVSRLLKMDDPHNYGSGNPGATNVLRSGKKLAAALTLLGDAAKGYFAVALAAYLASRYGLPIYLVALAAIAVLLGHMWPIFFRFKGGKGVATALGVLLALSPYLALIALITWLIIAFSLRISSLAALCAAISAPIAAIFLFGTTHAYFYACTLITLLIFYRHRRNIKNLLTGNETKIGQKAI